MGKKISKKNEQSLFNNRRFYPGGAAAWTALETDDVERVVDSVFREGFTGVTQAGQILPDLPHRKFLFLKIPIETGRRKAQEILADAWGRIKREPGKADWKRYQGNLDRLDADIAAWDARFEDFSYDDIVKSVRGHLKQISPLVEGTIEQVRRESRQKWGTETGHAEAKEKRRKKIMRLMARLRKGGATIEQALDKTAADAGICLSPAQVKKIYYSH